MGTVHLIGLGTSVPEAVFTQEEAFALAGYSDPKFRRIFEGSGIETRHLFLDRERFRKDESPDELHARYERGVVRLAREASQRALADADIGPDAIGLVVSSSCTGYLCPDLATILVGDLRLPRSVERGCLQGMGCGGAIPALQRGADFVAARGEPALVVAAEVCSAAYFIDDDPETVVGNAICADGAAAVVLSPGADRPSGRFLSFGSRVAPEHLDRVGFSRRDGRLRIVLKSDLPRIASPVAIAAVDEALLRAGRGRREVARWVLHPGGPRVLAALGPALGLGEDPIEISRDVYRRFGNMSSPTVLFVLEETLRRSPPAHGETVLLLALGPGLAAEAAVLEWVGTV